jgi:hypothetical protein
MPLLPLSPYGKGLEESRWQSLLSPITWLPSVVAAITLVESMTNQNVEAERTLFVSALGLKKRRTNGVY